MEYYRQARARILSRAAQQYQSDDEVMDRISRKLEHEQECLRRSQAICNRERVRPTCGSVECWLCRRPDCEENCEDFVGAIVEIWGSVGGRIASLICLIPLTNRYVWGWSYYMQQSFVHVPEFTSMTEQFMMKVYMTRGNLFLLLLDAPIMIV